MTDILSRLWTDRATVTVRQSYKRENNSTGFREVITIQDAPCKLSYFTSINSENLPSKENHSAHSLHQKIKLFIAPDMDIPPGSKIAVTREDGRTTLYTHSGKPSAYTNHQEILLELFDKWA